MTDRSAAIYTFHSITIPKIQIVLRAFSLIGISMCRPSLILKRTKYLSERHGILGACTPLLWNIGMGSESCILLLTDLAKRLCT